MGLEMNILTGITCLIFDKVTWLAYEEAAGGMQSYSCAIYLWQERPEMRIDTGKSPKLASGFIVRGYIFNSTRTSSSEIMAKDVGGSGSGMGNIEN